MDPDYRIEVDPVRRFVRLTLYGFWDDDTLRRYEEDLRRLTRAAAKAPASDRGARVLIDMRDHTLLSQDRASRLQRELTVPHPNDRTAILVAAVGMLKMQAERVAQLRQPRFFISEEDALGWLFTE